MKLIVVDEDNETVANVTSETKKAFDEMFGKNSPIGFTCDQCKNEENTNEQIQNAIMNEQKQKIDELQAELMEKVKLIQQLTDANEQPNNINEDNINDNGNVEDGETIINARELTTELMWKMNTMMTTKLDKISEKITENVTKKMKLQCKKLLIDAEQNKTGANKTQNPFRNNNNDTNGSSTGVADNKDTEQIRDEQTNQHIEFNEKLAPQATLNSTKEQQPQINQHTMLNHKLVTQFRVEKKIGNTISGKKSESDYNSFKIWTMSCETYGMIKKMWAPYYVAREFDLGKNRSTDKPSVTFDIEMDTKHRIVTEIIDIETMTVMIKDGEVVTTATAHQSGEMEHQLKRHQKQKRKRSK